MHRLLAFVPLLAFGASISSDFEGGSIGRVETLSPTHYRIGVKGEKDQAGRNRQASWYYFRVDGAPRQEMTLDMVDLPGEYNFQANKGPISDKTPPVLSYDGKTWTHVTNVEYDAHEPRLRIRVRPTGTKFWIAHTPPYTSEHLDLLRSHATKHRDFREQVIGKTAGGRDLHVWTISSADSSRTVWLMFRQHSWESGSSWVGEGVVRTLLSDSGADLRRRYTWKILPMCDPDGVARGGVRFNVHGFDLNRNWDVVDPAKMPEITAQRESIRAWTKSGRTVDLFLSLHNTETSEYLEGPPKGDTDPAVRTLAERFFAGLARSERFDASRPLFYAASTTTEGMVGRMTVIQGLHRDFQIPGFLMEQRIAMHPKLKRFPTIQDRLEFGRDLVNAIADALAAP